jgi:hypothetical protein
MGMCKVWVANGNTTEATTKYELEFEGGIKGCIEYAISIGSLYGWVVSNDRNEFVCSNEVPVAWSAGRLS